MTCALAAIHAPAEAQTVAEGQQAYLDADFEGSRDVFEEVLRDPELRQDEAADAHRYLLTLHLLLGDAEAARQHAEAVVGLGSGIEPPPGSPPEASEMIERARQRLGGPSRLVIAPQGRPEPDTVLEVVARLDPVAEALIASLRLECASGDAEVEERGRPPSLRVAIEVDGAVRCEAEALSAGGSPLLAVERSFGQGRDPTPVAAGGGGSPWPWIAAGAGAAIAAGILAAVLISSGSGDQAALGRPQVEGW